MEKVEGDERPREGKKGGIKECERKREKRSRQRAADRKRSERAQNEKMIRFTRSEATKFVVV